MMEKKIKKKKHTHRLMPRLCQLVQQLPSCHDTGLCWPAKGLIHFPSGAVLCVHVCERETDVLRVCLVLAGGGLVFCAFVSSTRGGTSGAKLARVPTPLFIATLTHFTYQCLLNDGLRALLW